MFRVANADKGTGSEDLTFALRFSLFQFFSLIFPARANQVEGWGRTEEPVTEGRERGEGRREQNERREGKNRGRRKEGREEGKEGGRERMVRKEEEGREEGKMREGKGRGREEKRREEEGRKEEV